MALLRYPIGMQSFSNIIEDGYAYVDKTQFIPPMLQHGKFVFLSRPRRFGKSLFISTLKAYFEGKRDLFIGLALNTADVDWTPSPVLHFDFNSENYTHKEGLELLLDSYLRHYEEHYGRNPLDISPAQRFAALIRNAHSKTGRPVVILIDEYDKPLLGIEKEPALFEHNQAILQSLFGNLKSMDEYIRFAFITGVARFSKVSIFSDVNNLKDISLDNTYSAICGITEEELESTFRTGIEDLAKARGETYEESCRILQDYYDGYLFTPKGPRLYNPFSVMSALDSKEIDPYWFGTGTPTFLVKRIKDDRIDPAEINGRVYSRRELLQVGLESRDPIPLMFQTGYLTIDTYNATKQRVTLRFPNREVEIAFAEELLPLYMPDTRNSSSPFSLFKFQDDLFDGNPENFMERLAILFKDITGDDHRESSYRAVTYLLCKLCSFDTHAEQRSYRGRSDLEVFTPGYIYLFEFKYNRSVEEAMAQIYLRDYMGRHMLDNRTVFLIGANFDNHISTRGLSWEIKRIHK